MHLNYFPFNYNTEAKTFLGCFFDRDLDLDRDQCSFPVSLIDVSCTREIAWLLTLHLLTSWAHS